MSIGNITSSVDIAISGLQAQAMRLKVIGNNIANAESTDAKTGEPYRRQDVLLQAGEGAQSGVRIGGVGVDLKTPFAMKFDPSAPGANAAGWVKMPNVRIPVEMMRMLAASQAYQANAAVLKRYQAGVDVTLELLK